MRILLSFLLLLSVSACGFHLRGNEPLPFDTLTIMGASTPLASDLKRAVHAGSNTRIIDKGAKWRLEILKEQREKVILSLNAAGRVTEYELRYQVSFRLVDAKMKEHIPAREIYLTRIMSYDDSQVLAKGEEESLLNQDMQDEAVRQMMRQLSSVQLDAD